MLSHRKLVDSDIDIATLVGLNERAVRYHMTQILQNPGMATRLQAATL